MHHVIAKTGYVVYETAEAVKIKGALDVVYNAHDIRLSYCLLRERERGGKGGGVWRWEAMVLRYK